MARQRKTPRNRTVTVAVTPNIRHAFEGTEIRGEGGFQSLCRQLAERVEEEAVLRFDPDEFKRVVKYATTYGEGGFQTRLRIIVSQFVAQHFNELVS